MQETQCPICYGPLEIREVAPCDDCGHNPRELKEFEEGYHSYSEYEVFPGLYLTLCNFCDADFASYDSTYFGLPRGTRVGIGRMKFVRQLNNVSRGKDKFCPACNHRLTFLRFVSHARAQNSR
jgi:hypothetical protein